MYIFQVVNRSNHQCPGIIWDITSKQLENSCYPQFSWFFPSDPKKPIRAGLSCLDPFSQEQVEAVGPRRATATFGDSPIFGSMSWHTAQLALKVQN